MPPGGAENVRLAPGSSVDSLAPGDAAGAAGTGADGSGTRPRNTGRPSADDVAVNCTRAAGPVAGPPRAASVSHTNVTRVWPLSARSVPVQNRAECSREGAAIAL